MELPKTWREAEPSLRQSEFEVKIYDSVDDTYFILIDEKYGGFKENYAMELGCFEYGTWIWATSLYSSKYYIKSQDPGDTEYYGK